MPDVDSPFEVAVETAGTLPAGTRELGFDQTPPVLSHGTLGMHMYSEELPRSDCLTSDLYALSQKGLLVSSSAAAISASTSRTPHGTTVALSCGTNMVSSDDSTRNVDALCANGVWVLTKDLHCRHVCNSDPLAGLLLDSLRVEVVSTADSAETRLWSRSQVARQLLTLGDIRYPPGTAAVLKCADDYSTNITAQWGVALTTCKHGHWSHVSLDCQPSCPDEPLWVTDHDAYIIDNLNERRFGGRRQVHCSGNYFATPPSWEGRSSTIECRQDGVWSAPPFRCVAGLTIDPSGGPGTVTRMLRTLFSTTGIVSLCLFFAFMVVVVIGIGIFWNLFYRSRADQAYQEQKKLLQEYLASTLTGASQPTDQEPCFTQSNPNLGETSQHSDYEGWNGRSPSSSTVSAVRRVVLLAGTQSSNRRRST
eukprot:Gregarina_sp_Poly_1__7313@NODE_401_length_8884_cov_129_699331_g327_i0_p2_GENE_NODE_401_length_8884_cov_129_699331_g327_i0NODE_401_length_8884_cov_129_699331_g327_i0_p2_ORF_typecomplete_len422_score38_25Sushi/PF00084_20/6_2Sushi/PF00084_20/0_29Sushi/PF00084_20/0_0012DUF4405/PF14358_6/0_018HRM/PF02793_22/3_5HRM/PF02793_22/1_1e02HRM/PF02793_22/4_6e03_NODE_401_length_8884_cov_129_699331_g327_i03421607